ncbi:orotate phosphoribosyltransferase [Francisella orientalis]|uniref:Orotate phosphoribosyltransferase n=1 Tax=Francisella orientalis TaxID=299583 RepID=A0AAP7C5N3_9GAMM|nr:orotate phosphoribosyltransferase [Francisella orientalis]AFJ43539.1 orotate phosphoribosyltransferase [Francisella orientalis str. Toba 04]AHB98121.1 orotate phosphoribosyltransferase [Francisella orientalis LADL 07-285A]AKN85259.1 Orotate phosphoribosyltransferase [Francisella orientalis FNO12]AKN86798.1 Orotate phosphoribosyltransferase [Francisella orientalis FNO24]AKN88337.1 Orotate phosphoribosyltransferase [Francisella orientalis]
MFIEFALKNQVLKFGEFTLKSGRISPYFFNAGLFNTGAQLATLADYYAQLITKSNVKYDILFGPAYKGIPLVAAISTVLALKYNIDMPYAFDRKEAKNHGEGGVFVGADMTNKKVLLIDDVMTAGTAFYESYNKLKTINAEIVGVVLSIDRQEKAKDSDISATKKISQDFNIHVLAVTNFESIFEYVKEHLDETIIEKFKQYRLKYGS